MKRFLSILITLLILFCNASCKKEKPINLYIVDGAPTLAVAKILNDKTINGKAVNVNVVSGTDVLNSAILSGNADIVVMPINLASKLHANKVDIKLLTVNIFGCLYIVGKDDATSLNDFKGKEINLVGKTGTPDVSLKYILNKKGIAYSENAEENAVTLKYIPNDTVISSLKANLIDYALIGEPLVSKAMSKVGGLKPLINIKEEWEDITGGKMYTQAGVVVTGKLINDDLDFVKGLYKTLSENKSFVYENIDTLNDIMPDNSALKNMAFNSEIISRCNLDSKRASEISRDIEFYLNAIGETYNEGLIFKGEL